MKRNGISRRNFLRGLGGTAIALPFFQAQFERTAMAGPPVAPTRYVVLFGGMSTGWIRVENQLSPGPFGDTYAVTQGLQPLETRGVRDRVSVVSNLEIPRSSTVAPNAPGGMGVKWHKNSLGPLLSGQRTAATPGTAPQAQTSDQFVADAFGVPGLHYRIQAEGYRSGPSAGIISYRKNGATLSPNNPVVSATQAYTNLVEGIAPTDPSEQARLERARARRKTAVDRALGKRELAERLGGEDRRRLERHFDELQTLERRLAELPGGGGGQCIAPPEPTDTTVVSDAYTNEAKRAPLLVDMMRMSFLCNHTRVATLCVTHAQSFLSTKQLIPSAPDTDCHETSHGGGGAGPAAYYEVIAWHTDVFAYLVQSFRDTVDVDGRSLLDNTAIIYLFEGGRGRDQESNTAISGHSSEDMGALVAGLAAGNSPGAHINGNRKHPASVLLTAMNNVGVPATSLNEVSTTIDQIKL